MRCPRAFALLAISIGSSFSRAQGALDDYLDTARAIDSRIGYRELIKDRAPSSEASDTCQQPRSDAGAFFETITFAVREHQAPRNDLLSSYFRGIFDIPQSSTAPVGFESHALCRVDRNTLKVSLESPSRVPDSETIGHINRFADRHNELRAKALQGDTDAKNELGRIWFRVFGCLSYSESLTTADTQASRNAANKAAPFNYRKPDGVKFYYDPMQDDPDSKLNIGLFQFSPVAGGNVSPCIRNWNAQYPGCTIKSGATQAEMIRTLGSSEQHFNAYCGVDKLMETFFVQANTTNPARTFPTNKVNGKLKPPADRCVTPHMAFKAYVHFSPFINSIDGNLVELMKCVME